MLELNSELRLRSLTIIAKLEGSSPHAPKPVSWLETDQHALIDSPDITAMLGTARRMHRCESKRKD